MFYLASHHSFSCFWFCLSDIYTVLKKKTYLYCGKDQMLHILIGTSKLELEWNALVLNVTLKIVFLKRALEFN